MGLSPLDVLAQEVELNSELMTYQLLYVGTISDSLSIQNGSVTSVRHQETLAFPITISGFPPYKSALAEVRVIIVPVPSANMGTDDGDNSALTVQSIDASVQQAINSRTTAVLEGFIAPVENMGLQGRNIKRLEAIRRSSAKLLEEILVSD